MNEKMYQTVLLCTIAGLLLSGFIFFGNGGPNGSRSNKPSMNTQEPQSIDPFKDDVILYTDNMDGANDTNALKARGYKPYYRGTGFQDTVPTWFQGNSAVFSSFNGPATGYVAANYQVVTNINNIDSWLVFPRIAGGIIAGDSLYYRTRTDSASIWPDSIRVMYSANDSVPEGSWTELGRFLVPLNAWTLYGFRAPTTSVNGRFCIRYTVANGGPNGPNSDYIGIDAINIVRTPVGIQGNESGIPKTYSLEQNYPNPFNPSTTISYGLPKTGNVKIVLYDILGNEVRTLVDENQGAGMHDVVFDASSLSSGIYLYKIAAGTFSDTKKMVLVK